MGGRGVGWPPTLLVGGLDEDRRRQVGMGGNVTVVEEVATLQHSVGEGSGMPQEDVMVVEGWAT